MAYENTGGIHPGRMNQRITIQRQDGSKQATGQLSRKAENWVDVCTVWAEAKCKDSGYVDDAGIRQHEMVYHFYIRWRAGLTADMRIVWQNEGRKRVFSLIGPPVDWASNHVGLTLLARELINYADQNV